MSYLTSIFVVIEQESAKCPKLILPDVLVAVRNSALQCLKVDLVNLRHIFRALFLRLRLPKSVRALKKVKLLVVHLNGGGCEVSIR